MFIALFINLAMDVSPPNATWPKMAIGLAGLEETHTNLLDTVTNAIYGFDSDSVSIGLFLDFQDPIQCTD